FFQSTHELAHRVVPGDAQRLRRMAELLAKARLLDDLAELDVVIGPQRDVHVAARGLVRNAPDKVEGADPDMAGRFWPARAPRLSEEEELAPEEGDRRGERQAGHHHPRTER